VLYTTPWGTGTGFDQGTYIGAARNLLAGRGLAIPWGITAGQQVTHFPPLFPVALAAIGTLGPDPWEAARYLNAVLRATNVLAGALLAARLAPGARLAPPLAGGLLLVSVQMEFVHGSAWSEPLFLSLLSASLWLLARHLAGGSQRALVGSAGLGALALLTRYAGLALVLSGLAVLAWQSHGWRQRLGRMAVYAGLSLAPLALWVARNALVADSLVGDRQIGWQDVSRAQLMQGLSTVFDWVLPSSLVARLVSPEGVISRPGLALLGLLVVGLVWWARREGRLALPAESAVLRTVLLHFSVIYPLCVVLSITAFDHLTQLDSRILSPVYLCLVALLSASAVRSPRVPVAAVIVALLLVSSARFALVVQRAHTDGIMYSNVLWLTSPTMRDVQRLPGTTNVFSNAPDAIYILARRNAYQIPDAAQAGQLVTTIHDVVRRQPGPVLLAYFDDPNIAYRNPVPPSALETAFSVRLLVRTTDGSLYEVVDGQ